MNEKQTPLSPQGNAAKSNEIEISINEILNIILRRKYGIILIVILSLAATLFYHYSLTPQYRAVAVMMIKGQNDMLSSALLGQASDNTAVKKDVKLLKSMPIAEMTVRELYKSNKRDSN